MVSLDKINLLYSYQCSWDSIVIIYSLCLSCLGLVIIASLGRQQGWCYCSAVTEPASIGNAAGIWAVGDLIIKPPDLVLWLRFCTAPWPYHSYTLPPPGLDWDQWSQTPQAHSLLGWCPAPHLDTAQRHSWLVCSGEQLLGICWWKLKKKRRKETPSSASGGGGNGTFEDALEKEDLQVGRRM